MGVRLDTGRHAHEHARPAVEAFEALDLVEGVDDDAPDAGGQRRLQLVRRLVVAVEHESLGRETRRQRHVELATGGDVEVQTFVVDELRHRLAQEGLAAVGDALAERSARLAAASAQVLLVVHEQRRAELIGQRDEIAAADPEPALVADARRIGQQMPGKRAGHIYIRSGACTPSRPRPMARPMRAASTSHSRAWVSSGDTPSPITQQSW